MGTCKFSNEKTYAKEIQRILTYPKRSIDIGGDEGGVCMDPAMVKEELAQWGLWWSPFNLSGGVNIPPPPSEIRQSN